MAVVTLWHAPCPQKGTPHWGGPEAGFVCPRCYSLVQPCPITEPVRLCPTCDRFFFAAAPRSVELVAWLRSAAVVAAGLLVAATLSRF